MGWGQSPIIGKVQTCVQIAKRKRISMKTYVFDTENNHLLVGATKFHCGGVIDISTGKEWWFRPGEGKKLCEKLDEADLIVAHKAQGYDIAVLKKLFGWTPKAAVHCSMVMSQVLNFRRFGFGHSLARWGEYFKDNKIEYDGGFEEFNEDMFIYMQQDVRLLAKVYKHLRSELSSWIKTVGDGEMIKSALRTEMEVESIMAEQTLGGWRIDRNAAIALLKELNEKIGEIEAEINPLLDPVVKKVDPKGEAKELKFTKNGNYHAYIIKYFDLDPEKDNAESKPIWGDFCRVEFEAADAGSIESVKKYLRKIGWKPDEYNWKKIRGKFVATSPKLTTSSLLPLGKIGEMIDVLYTYRSRRAILEGWMEEVDDNDHLHGDVFNIGTPTFRQAHQIIANLPSAKSLYGPEMRSLFIARPGHVLVSADSDSCQLRLLAHYMNDPDFTEMVIKGGMHDNNAKILNTTRDKAKPFIFAFLYGAGAKKLSLILGVDEKTAAKLKDKFTKAYPKLDALINKLNHIYETQGYVLGLDDRKVIIDSKHKALNYLIQSAEAIIMKATIVMIRDEFVKAGIDARPLLFYHDEMTYEVPKDQADRAREIIIRCFEEAPKKYGINHMICGDCKIGNDYYEVH